MEQIGRENPNYVVACVGGGSNAAGAFYHYLNTPEVQLIGTEAAGLGIDTHFTAASLAKGSMGIIHGSKTMLMQDKYGQIVEPHSISAGLDYPGIGPLHAHLFETGRGKFYAVTDAEALEMASLLARTEGIIPALESAHAFAALPQMNLQPTDVVVVNLSGRGDKDMQTYMDNYKL